MSDTSLKGRDEESEFKSPFSNCTLFVAKLLPALPFRVIKDSGDRIVLDYSAVDRSVAWVNPFLEVAYTNFIAWLRSLTVLSLHFFCVSFFRVLSHAELSIKHLFTQPQCSPQSDRNEFSTRYFLTYHDGQLHLLNGQHRPPLSFRIFRGYGTSKRLIFLYIALPSSSWNELLIRYDQTQFYFLLNYIRQRRIPLHHDLIN